MERIEQLMQLDAEKSEDVMLRDFVNKRSIHLNETLRTLANTCVAACSQGTMLGYSAEPIGKDQSEPRPLPKFSMEEEVCLAKCESKVADI